MAVYEIKVEETIKLGESVKGTIASFLSQRSRLNSQCLYRIGKNNYKERYNEFPSLSSDDEPIIFLHEDFVHGNQNADLDKGQLIDYPNMQPNHIDLLQDFFEKIFNKQQLEGTNKPSDVKKDGTPYNDKSYLLSGYYHYHCGPYKVNSGNYINNLSENNWDGSKSGPAIHYLKYQENGETKYIVVAFVISHGQERGKPKDADFTDKNKIMNTL